MTDERKEGEWYYVKNWWKFQHYRDRCPPWIKLHETFLYDPAVQELSETNRYRLVVLWLVASKLEGRCPVQAAYIARTWGLHRHSCAAHALAQFEVKGLISKQDIRGERRSSARPETETEAERERETEKNPLPPKHEPPIPPGFDAFWNAYPKKVGKPKALQAFKRQVKGRLTELMAGLERWKAYWTDPQYIPHPATFLNDRRWEDQPPSQRLSKAEERTMRNVEVAKNFVERHSEVELDFGGELSGGAKPDAA